MSGVTVSLDLTVAVAAERSLPELPWLQAPQSPAYLTRAACPLFPFPRLLPAPTLPHSSMILSMVNEPLVIAIKLADRLHNMRTV